MNAELKAQWIAALRSGEYEQGSWQLRYGSPDEGLNHCCLGVLCDVVAPDNWNDNNEWTSIVEEDIIGTSVLPGLFAEQVLGKFWSDEPSGIEINSNGTLPFTDRDGFPVSLTSLNDSGWFTFDQIADVIEWAF
jgi:hypothetical protein